MRTLRLKIITSTDSKINNNIEYLDLKMIYKKNKKKHGSVD